ncbi:MAG TPA: hypothetical protein VJR89_21865 [Polyangiales bacterium]|nr:hypothetical protein [Polyangiales bacterium]
MRPQRSWFSHSALLLGAATLGCFVAWSTPARAQIEGVRPEVHLDLGYHADIGFGVRVDIPIVPEGLLQTARDDLAITLGGDLLFDDGEVWVGIPVGLQWNFYIEQKWSVFPELGIALLFGEGHHHGDDVDVEPLLAVGGRYHFNTRNALVLRVGWPIGIQFGITF